jgi:PAS domain-containing protein
MAEVSRTPERAGFWVERISRVLHTGRPVEMEYDVLFRGVRMWFQARLVPEFGLDGEVASALLVAHDITALKE